MVTLKQSDRGRGLAQLKGQYLPHALTVRNACTDLESEIKTWVSRPNSSTPHSWENIVAEEAPVNSVKEQENDEPAPEKARQGRRQQDLVHKLWWRAHWLLPNTVPSPYWESERAFQERRDCEANAASRIPKEEELRFPVMWGIELFGPAEAEALYEHLARLKWSATGGFSREGGAVDWVRHQRSYGTGGGWYNIGEVVRQQDRQRWLLPHNFASLPDEVDYLHARFFQLTPSLTCALVGFVLKDDVARRYEIELNKDCKSVRKRSRHRWRVSTLSPNHLKSDSLELVRSEVRSIVGHWFKDNLPGYFCGRSIDRIPTAELLTTRTHRLFSPEREKPVSIWFDWQRLISNCSPFDIWTSSECQGFQLTMSNSHRFDDEENHMVAALCTADVPDESVKYYGGCDQGAYVSYCHEHLDGILSNYAALAFLREASKDVRSSRAALKSSKLGSRNCVSVLDRINLFFDQSLGAPAVAAELRSRSDHLSQYRHECSSFLAIPWSKEEEQRDIAKTLQEATNWLSTRVISEEHSAREHFGQLASILSVRESARVQRRMEWLTIAALVVATGSFVVAIPSIKEYFTIIRSYVLP